MHCANSVLDERLEREVTRITKSLGPCGRSLDRFGRVWLMKCSRPAAALLAGVLVTSSGCAYFRPGPPPLSSQSDEPSSKPVSWGFLDNIFYNQFTGP